MSSSSAERPALSIVVGSIGGAEGLEACLAALAPQVDGAEVLVCEPAPSPAELRARFPFASFHVREGALVPALWRDGIDASRGATVALTISPMRPAPDWVARIRELEERAEVVAGAIDPGPDLRLADWAEYFCRYARDMLPFEGHECLELPGDNAAYRRDDLERTRPLYRDGFWEPEVNRRLHADGVRLWHTPELVVLQGRSGGARAFTRQRLAHGRAHGQQRGARFGRVRNLAGVLGAPLVAPLLTARILRETQQRRRLRGRALVALPLVLWFNAAWAAGEARGHLDALRGHA
jgi:hypothetical protein